MNRNYNIYVLILVCVPVFVMAQQENRISIHNIVSPERQMLLEQFRDGRLDSLSVLLDSMDVRHPDPLLWPAERLLLYYWTERYDAIDSLLNHFDEICMETSSNHPTEQVVWNVLSYHSLENKEMLVSWIDQSGCNDREFDFRVQLLGIIIHSEWDDQTSVSREITSFFNQYLYVEEKVSQKNTEPDPIPPVTKTPDEPWSLEFGFGLGPTSVSGRFANYFSTHAGLSFNFNVCYNRWFFPVLLHPIFARLKCDIPVGKGDEVWETGKLAIISNFGLAAGYSVIDYKFFKMNPFIGLSFSECAPSEQYREDNETLTDAGIRWGFSCMYGIDTQFKLENIIALLKRNNFPVLFNVRVNYIPAMFNNVNPRYSGNLNFVSLGICMKLTKW